MTLPRWAAWLVIVLGGAVILAVVGGALWWYNVRRIDIMWAHCEWVTKALATDSTAALLSPEYKAWYLDTCSPGSPF